MSSNLKVNTILPSVGSNIGLGTNGGNLNVDGGCKVQVGTALTLGHTVGVQFATQNLHSAGFEVNNVNASGIITATSFVGSGINVTGNIEATGNLDLTDSGRVMLGTGDDLQIYHTGSASKIDVWTTGLEIATDGTETLAKFNRHGSVELWHDGTKRIETTNTGSVVSGNLTVSSGTSGDAKLIIEADTDNNDEGDNPTLVFKQDGGIEVSSIGHGLLSGDQNGLVIANSCTNGYVKFATGSTNGHTNATERLTIDGNGKFCLGTYNSNFASNDGIVSIVNAAGAGTENTLLTLWNPTTVADARAGIDFLTNAHYGTGRDGAFIRGSNDGVTAKAHLQFGTINDETYTENFRITSDGQALLSGLTVNNDPRNVKGLTIKSTSGVSFQNYGSNGSRNWRIRPDDMSRWGDLDFMVSPTANNNADWPDAASDKVLTLGYDGTVTKPRNPCFQAVVNGSHVSAGSYVVFGSVDVNKGGHYNSSNGIFTAPVDGVYLFHISSIAFNNKSTVYRFYLRINNGNTGSGNDAHLRIDRNNNGYANQYGANASYTYYKNMNANDTARVYFTPDDNSANAYGGSDYFKFGGHLVG